MASAKTSCTGVLDAEAFCYPVAGAEKAIMELLAAVRGIAQADDADEG